MSTPRNWSIGGPLPCRGCPQSNDLAPTRSRMTTTGAPRHHLLHRRSSLTRTRVLWASSDFMHPSNSSRPTLASTALREPTGESSTTHGGGTNTRCGSGIAGTSSTKGQHQTHSQPPGYQCVRVCVWRGGNACTKSTLRMETAAARRCAPQRVVHQKHVGVAVGGSGQAHSRPLAPTQVRTPLPNLP
jgi:hypothetical protein